LVLGGSCANSSIGVFKNYAEVRKLVFYQILESSRELWEAEINLEGTEAEEES